MKRYRNENGILAVSIDVVEKETRKEAEWYYRKGHIYLYESEEYVLTENDNGLCHFHSFSGKHLFVPACNLGTFLPDVADDELALSLVE